MAQSNNANQPATQTSGGPAARAGFPLDFNLVNGDDQPVLSTLNPAGQSLTLRIRNRSGKQITFQNPGDGADSRSAHFTLRWRKGALKEVITTPAPAGWAIAGGQTDSDNALGSWLRITASGNEGKQWNIVATGSANAEGSG